MPYHCLFQLPVQFGLPSITQSRWAWVSWLQAVSRGMPASPAYFTRSSWQSFQAGVCSGLMAPLRSVLRTSGITRPEIDADHAAEAAAGLAGAEGRVEAEQRRLRVGIAQVAFGAVQAGGIAPQQAPLSPSSPT
jgi:hypothetical protein